jgi:hypothetical protein
MQYLTLSTRILTCMLLLLWVACSPREKKEATDLRPWLQQGDSLRDLSQKTLMNALLTAGADSVPEQAVSFCHEEAAGILSQITDAQRIKIQRVAEKFRNPNNALQPEDLTVWDRWKKQLAQGQTLGSEVEINTNNHKVYRAPIFLGMPLCERCHGDENTFSPELQKTLARLYPNDKARNFRQGDLRGMWKITFLNLTGL